MSRSTNEISIEEVLRQLSRDAPDSGGSGSASDAALQGFLNTIASNSIPSQTYGIPSNTNSRGPVDGSGLISMSKAQADEITQQRITERGLGEEDSIFQILMETIIGEQGIPESVSAEAIEAIRGDFGPTTAAEELQDIAIDIAEAGGFDEWLAQQDLEGPPEKLPTELEEEVDIGADTTLEDEIGVEPDMPIDIPFPTLPPREEGEGDGEGGSSNGAGGNGEGVEGVEGGEGQEGQGETGQSGQTGTSGQTGETGNIPDYSDIGNEDYGYPGGLPGGGRGGTIYDVPVQETPGFEIIAGVPFIGNGSGTEGSSGGGSSAGGGGMLSKAVKAEDYFDGIGYQPVAVPNLILPNQSINTSIVPVRSRRDSFMDSSIVASMFKDLI